MDEIEVRCPNCRKLLLKVSGYCCIIYIICPRCGVKVKWPVMTGEVLPQNSDES